MVVVLGCGGLGVSVVVVVPAAFGARAAVVGVAMTGPAAWEVVEVGGCCSSALRDAVRLEQAAAMRQTAAASTAARPVHWCCRIDDRILRVSVR